MMVPTIVQTFLNSWPRWPARSLSRSLCLRMFAFSPGQTLQISWPRGRSPAPCVCSQFSLFCPVCDVLLGLLEKVSFNENTLHLQYNEI